MTEVLIGDLSLDTPDARLAFLVSAINDTIKPPRSATIDNVNIRAMYLANDLVNSHGGQFRREDLMKLCQLIVDTPVLVGHNRAGSPLARTFHAELEERENALWFKSYFYWPRAAETASDDLLLKIDSGILKECSLAFVYTFPECSVCGDDIRTCPHEVDLSGSGGDKSQPHFIYNGITQVLETSLVYKGSVKGTYVTDKLAASQGRSAYDTVKASPETGKTAIISLQSEPISLREDAQKCIARFRGHRYMLVKPA